MAKHQIMFYATAADLGLVLASLETEKALQYTSVGLFDESNPQTYASYADIPNFGHASHPDAVANPAYLVTFRGADVHIREVPQKQGGIFFAIDQMLNGDTVVLRPSARNGNGVLLCGVVSTVSQSETSKCLFELVGKKLRKAFKKVGEAFVGREAFDLWNSGVRLTIGTSSPPEFDLKRPQVDRSETMPKSR